MMLAITSQTVNEMYQKMLTTIIANGEHVRPRGLPTREIRPLVVRLEDSLNNIITLKSRRLNYSFMAAEWLWTAWGREDVEMITHYNKQLAKFSDDGKTFFGAYGVRIAEQLSYVLKTLRRDPNSRQAVLSLWRPNPPVTKDVPCTSLMQFMIRSGQLEAIVTMRSSDAWLGIPYDIFNFTRVQAGIAAELGLTPGPITLQLGSSHLYESDLVRAWEVLDEYRTHEGDRLSRSPQLPCWPPKSVEDYEYSFRTGNTITSQLLDPVWAEYLDALRYRSHSDLSIGDGHLMEVIRYVKA